MAVQVVDTSVCCLRLVPIDHVIFSDFHDNPDAEYTAQEATVSSRHSRFCNFAIHLDEKLI
jgi:hypothetical protein